MTVREYLGQAYRLEQRIRLYREEVEVLQEMAISVSSPGFEEHLNATRNTDAPYIKTIIKVMEYQDKINDELNQLFDFKREVQDAINCVDDKDERLVLIYRYLKNYTWGRIGMELYADESTIRRWHNKALSHFVLPENPTVIS